MKNIETIKMLSVKNFISAGFPTLWKLGELGASRFLQEQGTDLELEENNISIPDPVTVRPSRVK
jgi:hypothetical protein